MKQRAMVVPEASGSVLELGAGGGMNAEFYDARKVTSLIGIDPSTPLLNRAKAAWSAGHLQAEMLYGVAEDLPFDAGHFDTVVTTFTLCSVCDPAKALFEARRVLKPSGKLLFLEHGLAPDIAPQRWQRRLEPVWKTIAGGCHLTRPVTDAIQQAGFSVSQRHGAYLRKTPRFLGWVEWGAATPK